MFSRGFGGYKSNVALYPTFQNYFRTHKPPFLAVWGKNDPFFLPPGAEAFKRDIPGAVIRFFDTGQLRAGDACRGDRGGHPRLPHPLTLQLSSGESPTCNRPRKSSEGSTASFTRTFRIQISVTGKLTTSVISDRRPWRAQET